MTIKQEKRRYKFRLPKYRVKIYSDYHWTLDYVTLLHVKPIDSGSAFSAEQAEMAARRAIEFDKAAQQVTTFEVPVNGELC